MTRQTVIVIGGPTAGGKSGLAVSVARAVNGAVINADSMQLYNALPLLTAQPSGPDKKAVPHALYGVLDPRDTCNAARWRGMALAEIDIALTTNKTPVIVGGTGFYINTLLDGLSPIPEIPAEIRARGVTLQEKLGNPGFHAALAARDPLTAARLDPHNTQRNIRAWEVLEHTGKPLAAWQDMPREGAPAHLDFLTVTLIPERDALYRNCHTRFDNMIQNGALDEAHDFLTHVNEGPLLKALGYPELAHHINGRLSLNEATELAKQSTRNYAKRQTTWFRNQMTPDLALNVPDTDAVINALHHRRAV